MYCSHLPSDRRMRFLFFFFNDTATTEIYTLSLHDALPIFKPVLYPGRTRHIHFAIKMKGRDKWTTQCRSEEHTSELQSQSNLVCRLLLEKKKKYKKTEEIILREATQLRQHTVGCIS